MLDASFLVQLIIDYASLKTSPSHLCKQAPWYSEEVPVDGSAEAAAPLLTNLLSASAMDVIVARCRHGEKGIGDILHVVLQNCIIEKNVIQDSPKKPFHHRYKSQSSFLSSETPTSIQPGIDPEALDSWRVILDDIDALLCRSCVNTAVQQRPFVELGDPRTPSPVAWNCLRECMISDVHQDRMIGVYWIRDFSISTLQQQLLREDRSQMVPPLSLVAAFLTLL